MSRVLRVSWYQFRITLSRRWPGYLSIVLLVGLVGGPAMASIAGARRTQASYPTFLSSTNPSDLTVSAGYIGSNASNAASLTTTIKHLAGVKRVRDLIAPAIIPLNRQGVPRLALTGVLQVYGSLDGELADQDRVTVVQGKLANPKRADEVVMTATAARVLGLHVGQSLPLGFYTNPQTELSGFGTPKVKPSLRVRATLTGIVVLNSQVVQDDVDRVYGFILLSPALIRDVATIYPPAATPILYALQLENAERDTPAVEQEFINVVPPHSSFQIHVTSRATAQVELSVKPESVALGAFGAIAALVALVLAAQAISRQVRSGEQDRRIMRALGAGPATTISEGLIGVLAAVVAGSLLGVGVAVALSPLAPLGPVRAVYPDLGVNVDWTVIGVGFIVLVTGLSVVAVLLSRRGAPHRVPPSRRLAPRSSRFTRGAEAAGLPISGVMGVRFAFESGSGRSAVPVRSALMGTILAVALLVGTLTFGSGLSTLVSHPSLYGWNWSYMLNPSNNVPPQTLRLLDHDPDVASWSGYSGYASVEIEGQNIPILIGSVHAQVAPPILSGHGLDANNQIVLGAATIALLHKRVGDTVTVTYGTPKDAPLYIAPTRMRIVGTATFPAVGSSSFIADHTSMGTGALIPVGIEPGAFQRALLSPTPILNGPELVFVRLRHGVSPAAGRTNLQRVAVAADKLFADSKNGEGNTVSVQGVQRPAQIVDYHRIGSTPVFLAAGLAVGAIAALALTLVALVRRRRRDLALLKALGFTKRQLAAVVAWESSVTAAVGIVIGVPIGIVIGRQLWALFARNINAVPDPTVPVVSVVLVCVGAMVFANVVAALPGRFAARTPTALALRAE